jgi:UPF0716 protein FxsA
MLLLPLIVAPLAEVFVFVEVGLAIGWLAAVALALGTSVLGVWLLRVQGRVAFERLSRAVAEHRAPGAAAIDAALGFLGAGLLVVPGFVTDAFGALLVFPPTRALARRWTSRRLEGRLMRFVVNLGRVAPGGFRARPADIESTAVEDDLDQLGR